MTLGSGFESAGSLFATTIASTLTEVLFERDVTNSKWNLIGQYPGNAPVIADYGSGSTAIPTSLGQIFATGPTVEPGVWDFYFEGVVIATSGVVAGQTVDISPTVSGSGATATYTVLEGPSGQPVGKRIIIPAGVSAADVGIPVSLSGTIVVTGAGTFNIDNIASATDTSWLKTTAALGRTVNCLVLRMTPRN